MTRVISYDCTLRDGEQNEHVNWSLEDKQRYMEIAAPFVDVIEGGWPGANPIDTAFFDWAGGKNFGHARLAAFGMTGGRNCQVSDDEVFQRLVLAKTPVYTIFGKSWTLHTDSIIRVEREHNLEMIATSVSHLKQQQHGPMVVYDAEHFFDGFGENPTYALSTIVAAKDAGADYIVLCDTNGGLTLGRLEDAVSAALEHIPSAQLGIHLHNDRGRAILLSERAVELGATMVQGCFNGFGERIGNADLGVVLTNLALDHPELEVWSPEQLKGYTHLARKISELANQEHPPNAPYSGVSAFAHKAGTHADAVQKNPRAIEHADPLRVGNQRRVVMSGYGGSATVAAILEDTLRVSKTDPVCRSVVDLIGRLEHEKGYTYEGAEASIVLMALRELGKEPQYFTVGIDDSVEVEQHSGVVMTKALLQVKANGIEGYFCGVATGSLDAYRQALMSGIEQVYPGVSDRIHLVEYRVRNLNPKTGTASVVRTHITMRDDQGEWSTVGFHDNVNAANWTALVDGYLYGMWRLEQRGELTRRHTA
ncbi:citramalate synthase [Candidatus Woesearchaeota archaeon]|nr:MAG: 2-isopropylmalate synthase [archaeon GW2011_AR4]MBS3129126.1 citramalate synthase [Candidatus Woesearchaeota archaeon]HIH37858.1 citramalate synthase [Candidatus Woesearchaeota archaeon]HIH49245.1 citramalate synthase [Candidatus Woesearchaeota archaeon]